jgi:HK97 family phage major capsid protein/HK97 family phage prohead protease
MTAHVQINRAYSVLELKSIEEDQRIIRGIATTPTPDRMGDIVDPMGVTCAADLPLLHQHDSRRPVGRVKFGKPSKAGIEFEATLPRIDEPPSLKDRVDTAWGEIKAKLVRGVSIGFRALEAEPINAKDPWGPRRFIRSEVLELSLVTVPANADATITQIKSIDVAQRIASGPRIVRLFQPGDTGAHRRKEQESIVMRTLAEQIASFEATRAAKAARQNEIMRKTMDEGRTSDAAEQEEFDTLQDEIKAIDSDLQRFQQLEATNKTAARPPSAQPIRQTVSEIIQPQRAAIQLKQDLPKGTAFTRYVMALAASRGNRLEAAEFSKRWHDSTPEIEVVLRAAVTAGTTTDADWAQPLVAYRQMADEFIELLRPATIIGRIPGLRQVPFNVKIPVQTQGSLVNWVGETKPKPVGELKFVMIQLDVNKVAGIVVLSEELVRLSSPSAEAVVRADLVAQIAQFLDVEFIDPANAAVAGVSPASILNGVAGIPSSGGSAAEAAADLAALQAAFTNANLGSATAVYITTEIIAQQLAALQNPLGQPIYPGLQSGDNLNRNTVVSSQAVPAGIMALILPNEILIADDGGVTVDASREATLAMDSAPADGAAATFSLWQNNCVGIRAERWITWRRRRDQAVAYITGANYDGVAVP